MGETKSASTGTRAKRWRRRLIVLTCLALLVILFLILLPVGVRIAAERYLESTGMQADIEDVDINLFTGTFAVTHASAHTAAGDGFEIGHAEVNIQYLPLLSREIRLFRLAVDDSSVDIRRTKNNHLRVGGFTVLPWDTRPDEAGANGPSSGTAWGFGLAHVSLDGLTLHYLQPGTDERPEIERRITLNTSTARDINTWKPYDPAQIDVDLSFGDSSASMRGQFTAVGEGISGELEITTSDFALDTVAPLVRFTRLTQLTGRLDSDLALTASYSAADGLAVNIRGHVQWQQPRIATTDVLAAGKDWAWDGDFDLQLFQPEGATEHVTTEGTLSLASIDISMDDTLEAHQHDLRWQGQAALTLTPVPQARAEGALSIAEGDVSLPAISLSISEKQLGWQGTATYRGADAQNTMGRIATQGELSLASLQASRGDWFDWHQHGLRWQGETELVLSDTRLARADGSLSATTGELALPAANIAIREQQLGWQGTAEYQSPGAIHSEGRLTADAPRIVLGDSQLTIAADAFDFSGLFDLAAAAANADLPLTLTGDLDTSGLRIIDDALGRYLAASDQATAYGLAIETIDDIRIERLDVDGLRAFERRAAAPRYEQHAAVIRVARARADRLALQDLAALRIDSLNLSDATAIYARTDGEDSEISVFFGADDPAAGQADDTQDDFDVHAVRTVVGDGSTLLFLDTSVEPAVPLRFSRLRLELDDLNTDGSAEPARHVLSTNIGNNGTISSHGSFQVFGASGPDASVQASVDSVYLPPFSGYVMAALNRAIARGNLDAQLDLDVDDGELDGLLHVVLYNFALGEGYSERFQNALGISLDEAIALVRDSSGRIEFSTRILGNVTDPWFSTANLFRQALYAGLKSAIFSFYSPLGWVEAAGDLLADLASGLDFEPVIFKAGEAALSDDAKAYLSELADSLEQRPEPQIEVCGYAVPDDADARTFFGFSEIDADNRADLEALAAKRRGAVAGYLAARGVDKGRLAPCGPEIDPNEGARPRVTLSF